MSENNKNIFSKRLIELRKNKKLTQYTLADNLGCSRALISNYEQGRREPDFDTLLKIADYFNVSTDYMLGITNIAEIKELQDTLGDVEDIDDVYLYALKVFNIDTPYLRNAPLEDRLAILYSVIRDVDTSDGRLHVDFKEPENLTTNVNLSSTKLERLLSHTDLSGDKFNLLLDLAVAVKNREK